jgi:cell volume regulation protein A
MEVAKHTLISGGLILAIGTVTALLAQRIKIPDIPAFLLVGIAIGPHVLGLINISADSALNQVVLPLAQVTSCLMAVPHYASRS